MRKYALYIVKQPGDLFKLPHLCGWEVDNVMKNCISSNYRKVLENKISLEEEFGYKGYRYQIKVFKENQ